MAILCKDRLACKDKLAADVVGQENRNLIWIPKAKMVGPKPLTRA